MDVDPDTAAFVPEDPVRSVDSVKSNGSWTRSTRIRTIQVDHSDEEDEQEHETEGDHRTGTSSGPCNTENNHVTPRTEQSPSSQHGTLDALNTIHDCPFSEGQSDEESDFLFDESDSEYSSGEEDGSEFSDFTFQDNASFLENHTFTPNFIDKWLYGKYEKETSSICEKLKAALPISNIGNLQCTHLLDIFVPDSFLHLFVDFCNRRLRQLKRKETDTEEFRLCIVAYLRCAVYRASFAEIFSQEEKHWFGLRGRLNLSKERCLEILQSLSGQAPRVVGDSWEHISADTSSFLGSIEEAACRINRSILLTEAAVMSIDDDHIRQRSRKVSEQTKLKVVNNPKKAIGPVQTAICSALTGFFIVGHYSLQGDDVRETFENLFMFIQGAKYPKRLAKMPHIIVAADRGYLTRESIEFIIHVIGAGLIGTHKRSHWFPFVYGERGVARTHKGLKIPEKGGRAVFYATKHSRASDGNASSAPVKLTAVAYREGVNGRVALLLSSVKDLSTGWSSLAPTNQKSHLATTTCDAYEPVSFPGCALDSDERNMSRELTSVLSHLTPLTIRQSTNRMWFLLRAFKFTSRTSSDYLKSLCRLSKSLQYEPPTPQRNSFLSFILPQTPLSSQIKKA